MKWQPFTERRPDGTKPDPDELIEYSKELVKLTTSFTNITLSVAYKSNKPTQIHINYLNVVKDAPKGTGSDVLWNLCKLADAGGWFMTVDIGSIDREGWKKTSSIARVRRFYRRFGFVSNYREGYFQLQGNMHRPVTHLTHDLGGGYQCYIPKPWFPEKEWRLFKDGIVLTDDDKNELLFHTVESCKEHINGHT